MKNTRQKEAILEAVKALKNHPTADEIYSSLKSGNKKLSLGTVYRNLNAFAEAGTVAKISVPNSSDRFDFRADKHEHLQCSSCGGVSDVEADIDIRHSNPLITGYKIMFRGTCPECARRTATAAI